VPRGAILTGNGLYNGGITNGGATGVLVQGFVLRDFVHDWTTFPRTAILAGADWTIDGNEVTNDNQGGVELNSGNVLRNNWLHHNGRYGFSGALLDNILIEDNEIDHNNTGHYDINNDGGGSKIAHSSNVTFRGNNAHDNYGQGLWTDWANIHVIYESNTLVDNYGPGIFHEASADAVIRNNVLRGNGMLAAGHSLWWSADIFLNDSKNTEIYGNVIIGGVNGIGLVDIDRGSTEFGLLEIANVNVHDNTVMLPAGGATGLVGSRSAAYSSASGNHFENNTYYVTSTGATAWEWNGSQTWAAWRGLGNDDTGMLNLWPG
jgi:parallel beta-helix repeat protein